MKHTILPIVWLAAGLLGCAHHPESAQSGNVASGEQRAEARSEESASGDQNVAERRAEQGTEPVEMPQRAGDHKRVASNDTAIPSATGEVPGEQNTGHAPDNTGVNERDRNSANVTPMDQGNGEVDIDLTQRIRKAVMADDSLSFTAKNAKIITRDGRVTLRGPVKSTAEKDAVYKCAVSAAGAAHVSNELQVETK